MVYLTDDWLQWMDTLAAAGADMLPWAMFTDWLEDSNTEPTIRDFIRTSIGYEKADAGTIVRRFTARDARREFLDYTRELYPVRPGGEHGNMTSIVSRHDGNELNPSRELSAWCPFDVKLSWKNGLPHAVVIQVNDFDRDQELDMRLPPRLSEWYDHDLFDHGRVGVDFEIVGGIASMEPRAARITAGYAERVLKFQSLLGCILHTAARTPIDKIQIAFDPQDDDLPGHNVFVRSVSIREELRGKPEILAEWRRLHQLTATTAGGLSFPTLRYGTAGFEIIEPLAAELHTWLTSFGLDWPRLHDTNSPLIVELRRLAQRTAYNGIISLPLPIQPAEPTPRRLSPPGS